MDALLLLHPTCSAFGYEGIGDYMMDPVGRLRRRQERQIAPFIYAGIQILHPRLFAGAPAGSFSLNRLYAKAQQAGRLWGLRHAGQGFPVGPPPQLRAVRSDETRVGQACVSTCRTPVVTDP